MGRVDYRKGMSFARWLLATVHFLGELTARKEPGGGGRAVWI